MANKIQTSIRAYAADNIQIKRFLRVEDAQQLFHIENEVLLIVALSADALYQLPRTTLIHQKKMEAAEKSTVYLIGILILALKMALYQFFKFKSL